MCKTATYNFAGGIKLKYELRVVKFPITLVKLIRVYDSY